MAITLILQRNVQLFLYHYIEPVALLVATDGNVVETGSGEMGV